MAEQERPRHVFGPYRRQLRDRVTHRIIIERESGDRETISIDDEEEAKTTADNARRAIDKLASDHTFDEAVAAYAAAQGRRVTEVELSAKTVERDAYHLRSMLKLDKHGALNIRRLTPRFAEQLYDDRTGAVDTHRNALSVARAFGVWCVKQGWLRESPFAAVKGKGKRRKGKPQLRWEEARAFERAALAIADHDDGAVVSLCYLLLGPRSNEVLSRECRDVDDEGRILWSRNSKRRNGERLIRVPRQLAPFMLRLVRGRKPSDPLFAHAATRARAQDWAREQVWRICKLAGVPLVTPHGLRGTLATMGKEIGALSQHVADALDHASTSMTERAYIDRDRADAAAVERGWRVLEGVTSGPTSGNFSRTKSFRTHPDPG